MTLRMLDSIYPANLPPGADAYLGYVDGRWATFPALQERFPRAHLLSMAVFSGDDAEGCDVEAGDLTPSQVPGWVRRQQARGVDRPVVYASASVIPLVLHAMRGSVARQEVRLLSAHYGAGKHICGPATCKYSGCPPCDGTQWRDDAPGTGGSHIDESILLDDFFGDNVALTPADARTIWHADIIDSPTGKSDTWTPATVLSDIDRQLRALSSSLAADLLKAMDPDTIAETIAATVGPALGQQVVDALQARLAGTAPAS
jgi:hypothetical protein